MRLQHQKNIDKVQVLRLAPQRRQLFFAVVFVLYAVVGSWVYSTVGEPYATAILEANSDFIDKIGLKEHLSPTRANGLVNMIKQLKMYAIAYQTQVN